jgi:glycosyltransferase involved in cell wall biosynthesis
MMDTISPRITVLMSVYNAQLFIAEAVESVLNQIFKDFEFLIFEDKSTDSSLEILRSYSDPRIRLIANEHNQGLTKNLASGMRIARGEFVARMDADDVCVPNRLETQLAYLEEHPEISVLGSAVTNRLTTKRSSALSSTALLCSTPQS